MAASSQATSRTAGKRFRIGSWLAAALLGFGLIGAPSARENPSDLLPTVELQTLPKQARETYALVLTGGPFPYSKDGSVFGNRERLLPKENRGHYREYTVRTPGAKNRAARRLVCGGTPPTRPEVCYYSEDHYSTFRRVLH
jgi:ribonuclease T1